MVKQRLLPYPGPVCKFGRLDDHKHWKPGACELSSQAGTDTNDNVCQAAVNNRPTVTARAVTDNTIDSIECVICSVLIPYPSI